MTSHHIIKDGSAYSCLDSSARISQALLSPSVIFCRFITKIPRGKTTTKTEEYSMNHEQTNYEEDQIELLHFHTEEEIILWNKITKGEKENGKRI